MEKLIWRNSSKIYRKMRKFSTKCKNILVIESSRLTRGDGDMNTSDERNKEKVKERAKRGSHEGESAGNT